MAQTIFQVDSFTNQPFAGNPAGVCILPEPADETWMQHVAREMNLSETAFLQQRTDGDGYDLRWFTPAAEVDLCGHATLASAHILWETGHLQDDQEARFHTRSGLLTASKKGEWIEMDFPSKPEQSATAPRDLQKALGVRMIYTGRNQFDYLVEVASEEIVRAMQPDITLLKTLPVRGVMVTSRADSPDYDFVSRFFAPAVGVNEDPVTGSAHCCLGPYWSKKNAGQTEFRAFQASARGGVVRVKVAGERVILGGQAVTVLHGQLL
jgi:PhzF family phenazine biosynthesis protein